MKRLLSFLFLISMSLTSFSQKSFFIYIQAEAAQPFYVKLGDKTYNSSAAGYIILPKLIDSTYTFSLSFAKQQGSPQQYKVVIGKRDHGYLLKNFGEKGWGLYQMQTMVILMPSGTAVSATSAEKAGNVSPFTEVLSRASDDPSLKDKPVNPGLQPDKPIEKEVKAEAKVITPVVQPEVQPKAVIVKNPEEKKPESVLMIEKPNEKEAQPAIVVEKPVEAEEPANRMVVPDYQTSVVKKKSESSTTEGFGLVYTDTYVNGHTDTIRLIIANPKSPASITLPAPSEKKETDTKTAELTNPSSVTLGACTVVATESDFYELRKNMAAAGGDDAMIAEAVKYTKTKCFTTAQYKNLCVLFLNDQGRYKFFDAVYDYTSDPESFPSLQSELKEEYYINRFRAMLRK